MDRHPDLNDRFRADVASLRLHGEVHRMGTVREVLAGLTDDQLAGTTDPAEGPGWPPPIGFPVKDVLDTILNEEWWHRRFAERDLAVLAARSPEE